MEGHIDHLLEGRVRIKPPHNKDHSPALPKMQFEISEFSSLKNMTTS